MGFFGKLFGKGEHKNESQKDSVIKLNVNKKSSTFVAEIATKPDSELSHKGPQVFVIMNSKKDSRAVAMNLPRAVKNMLASKAQIIDLKNNNSAIHLCFDDNVNIRKSIDRLFNSNYGADLGDYGLTSLTNLRQFQN